MEDTLDGTGDDGNIKRRFEEQDNDSKFSRAQPLAQTRGQSGGLTQLGCTAPHKAD
jgi:hypothetical protein